MTEESNFIFGEFWGDVKCKHKDHQVRIINVGRSHYAVCDKCKDYTWLGSNLMSNWKYESEELWKKNSDLLRKYGQYQKSLKNPA